MRALPRSLATIVVALTLTAAPAFAGWIMLETPSLQSPLWQSQQVSAWDTAVECQQMAFSITDMATAPRYRPTAGSVGENLRLHRTVLRCVPADVYFATVNH
jgi:hypothetical protein